MLGNVFVIGGIKRLLNVPAYSKENEKKKISMKKQWSIVRCY